ncbi:MAG: D-aminoacyl-tRNA deacylase [Muribaculaceae bacterium]|nr:D-aminoacyl-tRNA deacylase [Muribaculaceae bacterium]
MRFLVQRVTEASVRIQNKTVGEIQKGFLVFVGISQKDTYKTADKMIHKLLNLRIFEDEQGKTNLNLSAVDGGLLIISQFTLYADCKHGNRPSFTNAGKPDMAMELYEYILRKCMEMVPKVQHGEFGAEMKVSLNNDGPFTVLLDSEELFEG